MVCNVKETEKNDIVSEYVADVISPDDVEKWKDLSGNVIIDSGTGTGKTTFIKNLTDYKLLYLCNRKALEEQFLEDSENIEVMLYQKLESYIISAMLGNKFKLGVDFYSSMDNFIKYFEQFDFIILDEAHYFVTDISFNTKVRYSLNFLFKTLEHSKKILMTATSYEIKELKCFNIEKEYHIDTDYSRVYFLEESKEKLLAHFSYILKKPDFENERYIIFCKNKRDYNSIIEKLDKEYNVDIRKDSIFLSSEKVNNNKKEKQEFDNIVQKREFSCKYLFTTKLLDNGISLNYNFSDGTCLRRVFIFDDEISTIIQEIGRIRRPKEEALIVYFKRVTKNCINRQLEKDKKELFMMFDFEDQKDGFSEMYTLKELSEPLFYMEKGKIYRNEFYFELLFNRVKQKEGIIESDYNTLAEYIVTEYYKSNLKNLGTFDDSNAEKKKTKRIGILNSIELTEEERNKVIEYLDKKKALRNGSNGSFTKVKEMLKIYEHNDVLKRVTHEEINKILLSNNIRKQLSKDGKYRYKVNDI